MIFYCLLSIFIIIFIIFILISFENMISKLRISNLKQAIYNPRVISLKHRIDRRLFLSRELKNTLIVPRFVEATSNKKDPVDGCRVSHCNALKNAIENNEDPVCIWEDDATIDLDEIEKLINQPFFSDNNWDGILLSHNILVSRPLHINVKDDIYRVFASKTTAAYVVRLEEAKKLVKLWKHKNKKLPERKRAIDVRWWERMKTSNWYACAKPCINQRPGYSDITKSFENYAFNYDGKPKCTNKIVDSAYCTSNNL